MDDRQPSVAQEIAGKVGAAMYERDHAAQALGMELAEIAPGFARMTMRVRPDMVNGHAICHGGFTFALADTAFAYACNSHNFIAVAQNANITFLAPGRKGEVLTATAEEQIRTGRSGVYDVVVAGEDGRRIALFRGISARIKGEVVPGITVPA